MLERLLAREHGAGAPPEPLAPRRPVALATSPIDRGPRMVVVAGVGDDDGHAALRSAAQWAMLLGHRVAVSDCFAPAESASPGTTTVVDEPGPPRVRIACTSERLALMRADVVAAVLERLRRLERSSDVLLLRIPLRERFTLMRAVFLGQALVLPLAERTMGEVVELARDVVQSFAEVTLWPFADSERVLGRFTNLLHETCEATAVPFDPARLDLGRELDSLPGPPEEGFLSAVLLPAAADVPAELLRFDSLDLV